MDEQNKSCCFVSTKDLMWWTKLLVAVLVIPSVAIIVTVVLPVTGMVQLAVFMIACWACTYLGMRLMANPKIMDTLNKK